MNKKHIEKAKNILSSGELVIFPTETVYGLGCNATNNKAINLLYKIKKRPKNNPIICHFANLKDIKKNFYLNDTELLLADIFWPGPLTLILRKKQNSNISSLISNNTDFVGCRIPNNKLALKLISSLRFPIAAPSANIASKTSVTEINDLHPMFRKKIFFIDDGASVLGLESTVIRVINNEVRILRLGSLTEKGIRKKIKKIKIIVSGKNNLSPGNQNIHYAPNKPLRMNVKLLKNSEALLNFGTNKLFSKIYNLNLSKKGNLNEASKNFFHYLHLLDNCDSDKIAVAPIPDIGLGKTINDRLKRAAKKSSKN